MRKILGQLCLCHRAIDRAECDNVWETTLSMSRGFTSVSHRYENRRPVTCKRFSMGSVWPREVEVGLRNKSISVWGKRTFTGGRGCLCQMNSSSLDTFKG